MALIRFGGLVTDISGKIGGQTLGTSASGSYIKNSGTPRKSITDLQQSKMGLMGTTAQRWRALTQEQRDTFNAASPDYPYLNRVGETKYYSGFAIFCQLANNIILSNDTGIPVPLPKISFTQLFSVIIEPGPGSLEMTGEGTDATAKYRLYTSRPSSVGISNSYKNQFFIKEVTATQMEAAFEFRPQMEAKWGPIQAGTKFFWSLTAVDVTTGQAYKNLNSGSYTNV